MPRRSPDVEGEDKSSGEEDKEEEEKEDEEPPPPQMVVVTRTIRAPALRCSFSRLPKEADGTPSMFFVRTSPHPIPPPEDVMDIDSHMALHLEYGLLPGHSLLMLEHIINEIYLPLLTSDGTGSTPFAQGGSLVDSVKSEFMGSIQKFSHQIKHALQQVSGNVRLIVPDILIDNTEAAAENVETISLLDSAMEDWTRAIATILESVNSRKPPFPAGPMVEIEHWRDRSASLSTLYEQLNVPNVRQMITVLELSDVSEQLPMFKAQFAELSKSYVEAKENVKFLATLERHFKNISVGSMVQVKETIPSLMNALRMVWIISRHYNTDECMVPLMERTKWQLCQKVKGSINVHTILYEPPHQAMERIDSAREMLLEWERSYLAVRGKIETFERIERWEFDQKRLFKETKYMADICRALSKVCLVLEEFGNILNKDLKAVTGDAEQIEEQMHRVSELRLPISQVQFDVFDVNCHYLWETVVKQFDDSVEEIDKNTQKFIDKSFERLRSAEGAFDLLQNMKKIKVSRPSIKKQMEKKYTEIIKTFRKELNQIRVIFEDGKDKQPAAKNQPPVAGSIAWCRSLFQRIKHTILRFMELDEMLKTPEGQEVAKEYVSVGKMMREYEERLFGEWRAQVEQVAVSRLKQPILAKTSAGFELNFDPELTLLIRETKYLDRLGFNAREEIPETAVNVTLQEAKYFDYCERIRKMLASYKSIVEDLSPAEKQLLKKKLEGLDNVLKPGFKSLNWNSLGIPDFLDLCNSSITQFQALVSQVQKNASNIQAVVQMIADTQLIKDPVNDGEIPDLTEFVLSMTRHRDKLVEALVAKYHSINGMLGKIELLVSGTRTGRSPDMKSYYKHWEVKIFNALTLMISSSQKKFHTLLLEAGRTTFDHQKHCQVEKPPLFRVSVSLNGQELAWSPPPKDIVTQIVQVDAHVVFTSHQFGRWMDGMCHLTPPQAPKGDEEVKMFTFWDDIRLNLNLQQSHQQVLEIAIECQRSIERTVSKWFAPYKRMCADDVQTRMARFSNSNPPHGPSVVEYDRLLYFYTQHSKAVEEKKSTRSVDFVQIQLGQLALSVRDKAQQWVSMAGIQLRQSVAAKMAALNLRMETFASDLSKSPESLNDLKFVLQQIESIRQQSMDVEIEMEDIQERYRTMALYSVSVPEDEEAMTSSLGPKWIELGREASRVDQSLVRVKRTFTQTTQHHVRAFVTEIEALKERFFSTGPGQEGTDMDAGVEMVEEYRSLMKQKHQRREELVLAEKLFNLSITSYPALMEVEAELKSLSVLYGMYSEQKEVLGRWSKTMWADVDVHSLEKDIDRFLTQLKKKKDLRRYPPYKQVDSQINTYASSVGLFSDLKNEALRDRHWRRLMEITGTSFDLQTTSFTLEKVFAMHLEKYADTIKEITSGAKKEMQIELGLHSIEEAWKQIRFEVVRYTKGATGEERGFVLKGIDDITMKLEDHTMNLQTVSASRYAEPFREKVDYWEKQLSLISEVTEVWMAVQRKWMYLESIFVGSVDIRLQLPDEAKRFDSIDSRFQKIMNETARQPEVLKACEQDTRLAKLQDLAIQLERCQKSLSDYLETKRNAFPRFFFISDDELLSILGSHEPSAVQEHMIKLFENALSLKFGTGRNAKSVLGMISCEDETFSFRQPVTAEGPVESWMGLVEEEMKRTLHILSKEAIFDYPKTKRVKWIEKHLGMASLSGSQIWWTWQVEDVFEQVRNGKKHAMKELLAKLSDQIDALVTCVRGELTRNQRKKVNTLIIIDVHARDLVNRFVRDSILNEREFEWESQLRYYWDKTADDIAIRQCTGSFAYGYEFQGLNGRLVITPLTDRCIMTLTQALSMRLGGSPAGPAGTGKTETVKDLAKAFGLHCVVFNCGEGLDYKAMGRIFSGLVQTGSWGCFDEFNRIDLEVLSVISGQIKRIQNAMSVGQQRFEFEGRDITLDYKTGIFITMNPGYGGRVELPENLKALFRPVVMVVPDEEMICEIMLFSQGFSKAPLLARKMTVLFHLAEEQLSKQHMYDWGLRALRAVLVMAGGLKRDAGGMDEEEVIMRALRDMNRPKFILDDEPLFNGLLSDLFPKTDCPRVPQPQLKDAVLVTLKEGGYKAREWQVDKVVQLWETMQTRHTTMVVGPTGGGKSVVIETLAKSQTLMGLQTRLSLINPKAQTIGELYGVLDPNTRDWTDGLFSSIFRDINDKPSDRKERRYVLFDGDVDPEWVENMNSVMDDNKLLTLPNGERIRLQKHCALLYEVSDLQYASPATISRCGMVYVDARYLGFSPFFFKWVNQRENLKEVDILQHLFDKYVSFCLDFIFEGKTEAGIGRKLETTIPLNALNMVEQLCTLLGAILTPEKGHSDDSTIEAIFIFCLVWSLGGALTEESRLRFDGFVKTRSDLAVIESPDITCGPGQVPAALPTLYDYFFDDVELQWKSWKSQVTPYQPPSDGLFYKILVPTVDTVRNTHILQTVMSTGKPLLFVGETGTAKTVTIQNWLRKVDPNNYLVLNVNFSSRTSSMDVQRALEDNVERRTRGVYGPTAGRHLTVFLDDLNMPTTDKYGTQQPIALLRTLVEKGGMWARGKDIIWMNLKDVHFLAAMGPPGGGRHAVNPRFTSKFSVFNITFPSEESLLRIYTSILSHRLEPFAESIKATVKNITSATLRLYQEVTRRLPPTPAKFHYVFNLRDLSRVYEGLCLATTDSFDSVSQFVRLWRNESLRVFHDRLISHNDRLVVTGFITDLVNEIWGNLAEDVMSDPLVFGDYRNRMHDGEARVYEDLRNYHTVRPIFEEVLDEYNEKHRKMKLVLFDEALEHLTRVHRIIRMNRGHALLVGVAGCGKQSLTRLATYCAGFQLFEIQLKRIYRESDFREDLKILYEKLGREGQETVFMFTDAHVVEEGFLELINNMLTSGVIPGLFPDEEKEAMINSVRDEVTRSGLFDNKENCWQFFINKCRDNLHIVLPMSPGDVLRMRCRNFPGLVNSCVIDWFETWPEEALGSVSNAFLADEELPDDLRDDISRHMVQVHLSVGKFTRDYREQLRRHNYVTPKNYLDYISQFILLLKQMHKRNKDQSNRLEGGLDKLAEAGEQLKVLKEQLSNQWKIVDEKKRNNELLMDTIKSRTVETEEKSREAEKREKELSVQTEQIGREKDEADRDLQEALPVLLEARQALADLEEHREHLTEIRSFARPAEQVQLICECVAFMLGYPTVNWKVAKGMMAKDGFLRDLIKYEPDNLTSKIMSNIRDHLKKFDASMADAGGRRGAGEELEKGNREQMLKRMVGISTAATSLLRWVYAIENYYGVYRRVKPKKEAVEMKQKHLRQSSAELEKMKQTVSRLTDELEELTNQWGASKRAQDELTKQAEKMEKRLKRAAQLISGLSGERTRWRGDLEKLALERDKLLGDSLLSAAFLSYTAAFNYSFRREMVYESWQADLLARGVPLSQPFRVEQILASDVDVARWASEGLPSDELSVQNGILTTNSTRWPLCIDPQLQAVSWIKKREGQKNLKVCTFNDPDFLKHLELAVTMGLPFLFEGVDEYLDPVIDPVLEKDFRQSGSSRQIKLGDKEIDWDDDFRLYLTTRLANPDYSAAVAGKTTIINYGVTQQGLQDQLLQHVVLHERPELESQREALVHEMSENRALLKDLEDTLLRELASSKAGSLLDNDELIAALDETRQKASDIGSKLEIARDASRELAKLRDGFRPAAKRGAILFFVLSEMVAISPMYEFSLSSFLEVFNKALETSQPDPNSHNRLRNIIDEVTISVYNYGCTGLFERHKLMFSFQMAMRILAGEGTMRPREVDFFVRGNVALTKAERRKPFSWFPEQGWEDLMLLVTLGAPFDTLADDIERNEVKWREWYDKENPEEVTLPAGYDKRLDDFQQLCLLRCLRQDRVFRGVKQFVVRHMGDQFVEPPVIRFEMIHQQSSCHSPIVFVLSPGADPDSEIRKLAEKMGFGGNKFKTLALGQGQGQTAQVLVENGAVRGQWIVLLNCHLLTSWLRTLEKILEKLDKRHQDFRLWLTTEPTHSFPVSILQKSLKVVTEPPSGLKLNMRGSYSRITDDQLGACPHPSFRPLVFVLGFFHAVVQERCRYGKIGWNVSYDFNESDFRVSLELLNVYLTKSHNNQDPQIPWGSLRYLIGEAMYGGRVTDDLDRRVLMTYLDEYMGDFLFDSFQPFRFYQDSSVEYSVPQDGSRDNYVDYIEEKMARENSPTVLGLHANAEIGYYAAAAREMWRNVLDVQPRTGGSSSSGPNTPRDGPSGGSQAAARASEVQAKIPSPFDMVRISKSLGTDLTPTQVVLKQELERWNVLVMGMTSSLKELQKALIGDIPMSQEMDALEKSLDVGEVPSMWRRLAPDTMMGLGAWVHHFTKRHRQYQDWITQGEPVVMWLSGLHVPGSYLVALVQTAVRATKGTDDEWSLDRATLLTEVTPYVHAEAVGEKPEQGCYIQGLFLEGAAWDFQHQALRPQDAKELVVEMPIIKLVPVDANRVRLKNVFQTPVYVTSARRNSMGVGLVFTLDLPSVEHASHWILQGTAVILNKSDE